MTRLRARSALAASCIGSALVIVAHSTGSFPRVQMLPRNAANSPIGSTVASESWTPAPWINIGSAHPAAPEVRRKFSDSNVPDSQLSALCQNVQSSIASIRPQFGSSSFKRAV